MPLHKIVILTRKRRVQRHCRRRMKGSAGAPASSSSRKSSPFAWDNARGVGGAGGKPFPKDHKSSFSALKLMVFFLLCVALVFYPLSMLFSSSDDSLFAATNALSDVSAGSSSSGQTETAANDRILTQSFRDGIRNNNGSVSAFANASASLTKARSSSSSTKARSSSSTALKKTLDSEKEEPTGLQHIVFGIAASADLWERRKEYIKLWWRPGRMRGYVWLDRPVKEFNSSYADRSLPALRISGDTTKFPYTHQQGSRSAIRISRIVSETYRLGLRDVRWYVMGDDDTVFLPENLAGVLSRFDHRQPYYIGSLSESHLQNIFFSYGMAYGGGGFAISAPLVQALAGFQDRCIRRYPALYGSDDRIQACMAELGVPLTKHPGFHQYDVYGNLFGLLTSHPVAPLLSLHHLDVVEPVFPGSPTRAAAIRRLFEGPVRLDSAGVMQQSICYDVERERRWTVSVSWGFAVLLVRGVMSPRELEMPARTFLNWYRRADYTAYAFNTRPVARNPCQKPFVYYLASSRYDAAHRTTVTTYQRRRELHPACRWHIPAPSMLVDRIVVYKKPDPDLWTRSPRRNCCRVLSTPRQVRKKDRTMVIDVGMCRNGEISEVRVH